MAETTRSALLVIIDALASRVANIAMNDGRLPHLARLARHGVLRESCWSMFPSITPAATCSLHTGLYPRRHGVAGAYWYDRKTDRVAYFGDDIWAILEHGHGRYFREFEVALNYEHLRVPTVYELAHKEGLRAACVNSMWFRGPIPHEVHLPWLFKLIPGVKPAKILHGPDVLCMADFVSTDPDGGDKPLTAPGGPSRRFGFHDETTAAYLLGLAERGPLPAATVAYFPNNDFESHEKGPHQAVDALKFVDESLGRLFEARGGLDAFLQETAIFITGDHSQTDMHEDADERGIDLHDALGEFSLVPAGDDWDDGEQVMVCPNMRTAEIYLRDGNTLRPRVIRELLLEPKVDQVLWTESGESGVAYHVATADHGEITFQPGSTLSHTGRDPFGTTWSWDGDLNAVDGALNDGELSFGDYPNAFERIAGGFFDEAGQVLATARPGYEFVLPGIAAHPGGSHGSLHAIDSTSPLIAAGLPDGVSIPDPVRTVDVVPLMSQVLNVPFAFIPGQGRAPE